MGAARITARTRRWACSGPLIALLLAAPAQAVPSLVKVGDFTSATYVTAAPGDASRLFVTEQAGRIRLVRDGTTLPAPFLDITADVEDGENEQGLLSMAFAPDYATTGRFYVYFTAAGGEIQIREYRRSAASADVADPGSARLLLAISHNQQSNHNGGQLQFGPDGKLWLGTGDGGGANNEFGHAQDPASLLGKLIRLNPAAPAPEVVSVGLRNPWRFSFDRVGGTLVIGDVGQNAWEEIDVGVAANYGWSCREGLHAGPGPACSGPIAEPVLELAHPPNCSITGGYVVRDPGLPTLAGRYLYTDFCNGELRSLDLANAATDAGTGLTVDSPTSFGEDSCGRLLVVSRAGPVYRIVDGTPSPCTSTAPPGSVLPPADARPCSLAARVTGRRSVHRLHRLSVALRVDEACQATVRARIKGVATFRTVRGSLAPGARHVLRVRLTAKGLRAVRSALRRHRSLRVAVRVQVVDASGNVRTLSRGVRVRG